MSRETPKPDRVWRWWVRIEIGQLPSPEQEPAQTSAWNWKAQQETDEGQERPAEEQTRQLKLRTMPSVMANPIPSQTEKTEGDRAGRYYPPLGHTHAVEIVHQFGPWFHELGGQRLICKD